MKQPYKKAETIGINVESGGKVKIEKYVVSQPKYKPAYNLPYPPSQNFVGREGVLARLHGLFQNTSCPTIAVVGMAGVGKTELALQYASSYGQSYGGGCYWLGMRDKELADVLAQHLKDAFDLDLPLEKIDRIDRSRWCWDQWERNLPEDSTVLVVLDNVDEAHQIGGMLPGNPRFRLLVTTRKLALDITFKEEQLEEFTNPAALAFLSELLDSRVDRETEAAQWLCHDLLGNLPLGIELAGRYLQQDSELSISEFVSKLSIVYEAVDQHDTRLFYPTMTAERGVKSAIELSWQKLESDSQTVAMLLGLFALQVIPWELATEMAEIAGSVQSERETASAKGIHQKLAILWKQLTKRAEMAEAKGGEKINIKEVRQQLENLNLIKWDKDRKTVTLHALVRVFLQEKSQSITSLKQIFVDTLSRRSYLATQDMNLEQVTVIRNVVPHIEEVANYYSDLLQDDKLLQIFVGAAFFYSSQGLYALAELLLINCLEVIERRLGVDHLLVATSLNNLGAMYSYQGRYKEAEPLCLRSIEISKIQQGEDLAISLNNLGGVYFHQGRYSEVEPLYLTSLDISKKKWGESNLIVSEIFDNLGRLYCHQGLYTESESFHLKAIKINESQLGFEHTKVAKNLNNLAELYREKGDYIKAEPLYLRAIEINEFKLGVDHLDLADNLNNLALLYAAEGNNSKAKPLYLRSLEIRECKLGVYHPRVSDSFNNIANLYQSEGDYNEAERLYLRSLEIDKRCYGEDHHQVAIDLSNLAMLYAVQNKYTQAEDLSNRALIICRKTLGEWNPKTRLSLFAAKLIHAQNILECNIQELGSALASLTQCAGIEFDTEIAVKMLEKIDRNPVLLLWMKKSLKLYSTKAVSIGINRDILTLFFS
jgi:tetratricopeptide (TPR) repeat protein